MGPRLPIMEGKEVDGDHSHSQPWPVFGSEDILGDSREVLAIANFESDHSGVFYPPLFQRGFIGKSSNKCLRVGGYGLPSVGCSCLDLGFWKNVASIDPSQIMPLHVCVIKVMTFPHYPPLTYHFFLCRPCHFSAHMSLLGLFPYLTTS